MSYNLQDAIFQNCKMHCINNFRVCVKYTLMSNNALRMCVIQFSVTVRNAGNVIPHSQHFLDEATTTEPAALELGCVVNDIRHVIVCGHSDCKVNKSY